MLSKIIKLTLPIVGVTAILSTATAQKIKTIEATEQSWSGGIAGRRGQNFSFVLEFSGINTKVKPDTLWIGTKAIALWDKEHEYQQPNVRIKHIKKTTQWAINTTVANNDYDNYPHPLGDETKPAPEKPPVKYEGVALLKYKIGKKTKFYTITKIQTHMPPVNYP